MNWEKEFIARYFDGDKEKYEETVAYSHRDLIHWSDLLASIDTLPQLAQEADELIERRLGYLPHVSSRLPYEVFLRGLIQSHRQGILSQEDFSEQADSHIKLIRKEDLKQHTCLVYDKGIYKTYQWYLQSYAQGVQDRLTRFLGYTPALEHSLVAELWFREVLARDTFQMPYKITGIDLKCLTLIKYRELLLAEGQAAADDSPLLGIEPA